MPTIPLLSAEQAINLRYGAVGPDAAAALIAISDRRARVVPVLTEAEELEAFEAWWFTECRASRIGPANDAVLAWKVWLAARGK